MGPAQGRRQQQGSPQLPELSQRLGPRSAEEWQSGKVKDAMGEEDKLEHHTAGYARITKKSSNTHVTRAYIVNKIREVYPEHSRALLEACHVGLRAGRHGPGAPQGVF